METFEPKRVFVSVSRKSPYWSKAWTSSEEVISVVLRLMRENNLVALDTNDDPSQHLFLVKERWDKRTFIVFDIFNNTYNPDNAHLPGQNDLPVISVFLHRNESANIAGGLIANQVNKELRDLHNSTGPGSQPPFIVDHANGKVPSYPNPRTCTLVVT